MAIYTHFLTFDILVKLERVYAEHFDIRLPCATFTFVFLLIIYLMSKKYLTTSNESHCETDLQNLWVQQITSCQS